MKVKKHSAAFIAFIISKQIAAVVRCVSYTLAASEYSAFFVLLFF